MKKAGKYILGLIALCVLFTGSYYLSYRQALRRLRAERQEQNMSFVLTEHMTAEEQFAALNGPVRVEPTTAATVTGDLTGVAGAADTGRTSGKTETTEQVSATPGLGPQADALGEEIVEADAIRKAYILPDTKVLMETYDMETGEFTVVEKVPDAVLIGMTREELLEELQKEIENMPVSEYEKGLISSELITFSEDKVIIRHTYDKEQLEYLYYIAVKSGEVVVYYSDHKTVYEYTGIQAAALSEEIRLALMSGIPVKTADELFALLESFSS